VTIQAGGSEISLAAALTSVCGWRDYWFERDGHAVRCARINLSFMLRATVIEPFRWRHRVPIIRQVPAKRFLSDFSAIRFDEAAYSHFLPAKWFDHAPLLLNQWLQIEPHRTFREHGRRDKTEMLVTEPSSGQECALSLAVLSVVSGVRLRR
jgi:hypothetical protein